MAWAWETAQEDGLEVEPLEIDTRAAVVYGWRIEELERAGYSGELAPLIAADHRIDLHLACDLLRRGCPEGTAYRILA
jgi:hypothetical protein